MPKSNSVYLLGIGGIAMANVAVLLRSAGYDVTGSDQGIYEPAASLLRRAGISAKTPYAAENLPDDSATTIIVGNVQSRGQVEVEEALRRNFNLESFPGFLRRTVMSGRTRMVVAGTHGKSTTTACAAFLLHQLNRKPGFLIGADPLDLPFGGSAGSGSEFVIEGDEYDSAFFDKRSKFLDYFPRILILGRVEHDHLDIFPTLEEMLLSFRRLVAQLPSNGKLIVAADSPLAAQLAEKSPCEVISVSAGAASSYRIEGRNLVTRTGQLVENFAPGVIGEHNRLNVAMAIAGVAALNLSLDQVTLAARSFHGIKRRMERIYDSTELIVFDDFAHHPTAIAAAIDALREEFPQRKVVAVFEPRSNTAVRNKYQDDFRASLSHAHEVIVGSIHRKEKIPRDEVLDMDRLIRDLMASGIPAVALDNQNISLHLQSSTGPQPTVVVFMSNGSFGGAPADFVSALHSQNSITA